MYVLKHPPSRYAFYSGTDWIDQAFMRWAVSPHSGTGIPAMRQKIKAPYLSALQYKGRQQTIIAARNRQNGHYVGMVVLGMYYHFIRAIKKYDGLLASAFASNRRILKMLTSRQNSPIAFTNIGTLYTYVFYPKAIPNPTKAPALRIQSLQKEDMLKAFLQFWHHRKDDRDFIPAYTVRDFDEEGLLRDLRLDDIFVAIKGDAIVGSLGLWDQSPTRTWVVDRYPTGLRLLRPLINVAARWRGTPALPRQGEDIPYRLACLLRIRDDDPEVLWALFHALSERFDGIRDQPLLVCALHQRDPLRKWIQWPHYPITSQLLFSSKTITMDSKCIPYVELGAL